VQKGGGLLEALNGSLTRVVDVKDQRELGDDENIIDVLVDAAQLDLLLEIMPKPEFLEKQKLVFLLLARFMASPGVYRVPIKGTLLKPVIL